MLSDDKTTAPPIENDPATWVEQYGDDLYRFALARVGRADVAEDLVQETLLAALKSADKFAGRSSVKTWLTAILKNKYLDFVRRRHFTLQSSDLESPDDWLDGLYEKSGHWRTSPRGVNCDPAALLQRREFWQAFEQCRGQLPDRLRDVLSLRLVDDVPSETICQSLGITSSNLWTMLHRARVRLWKCLDRKASASHPPLKNHDVVQTSGRTHFALSGDAPRLATALRARHAPWHVRYVPTIFPTDASRAECGQSSRRFVLSRCKAFAEARARITSSLRRAKTTEVE